MKKPLVALLVALALLTSLLVRGLEARRVVKIVAFGDSLTYGTGSAKGGGYVTFLAEDIAQPIENFGVPGNTTADGLKRVADVIKEKPDIAIVLLGGNDYLDNIPEGQTFQNLDLLINKLKAAHSDVLLLGLSSPTHGALDNAYFSALAAKDDVAYIPDILGGIWGTPALMSDDLHPNDEGYRLMAKKIEPALEKLLH